MLVAESGDEAIGEVTTERCLETIESRSLRAAPRDCAYIGEQTRRAGRSDLCENGGTHVSVIGGRSLGADPWRE